MIDNVTLFKLSHDNPGAKSVIVKVHEHATFNNIDANNLYNDLLAHNIVGPRLWYLYKRICKQNINKLFNIDFHKFDDEFFTLFEKHY